MKLHIGCGCVYLEGYINIDASPHYLIWNAPNNMLEQNRTTLDNYYKHDFCKGSGMCVADKVGKIDDIDYEDRSIEEIVMLHVLEHLPTYEVSKTLEEFHRILIPNGKVYIAVPDVKETAKLLAKAETPEEEDWAIRLIHGTQRNKFSHHFCGYTKRTLKALLESYGFGNFKDLPNINFYPAIHLEAYKL